MRGFRVICIDFTMKTPVTVGDSSPWSFSSPRKPRARKPRRFCSDAGTG